MISGISNMLGSMYSFITNYSTDQNTKNSESISHKNCHDRTSAKSYFRAEQTETLFQTPPIYSRIITNLNFEDLDALKQAISQKKSMRYLSSNIEKTRKERLKLLCTPKETNENLWKKYYQLVLDGRWLLDYVITGRPVHLPYPTPPEILKVYSFDSSDDWYGCTLNMYGVLVNGDVFSIYAGKSKFQTKRFVGVMEIYPDWDSLFTDLNPKDLISFIKYMGGENSTASLTGLETSEEIQIELKEALIEAFRSTTPSL